MDNQNQTPMEEKKKDMGWLKMWLPQILIAVVTTSIAAIPITDYLQRDIELKYAQSSDIAVRIGPSDVSKNLVLRVSEVNYKDSNYEALRVIRFRIFNESNKGLSDEQFVFETDSGQIILGEFVVDIACEGSSSSHGIVDCERNYVEDRGPGFRLISDFPGKSDIDVSIILDSSVSGSLADTQIGLNKMSRSDSRLERLSSGGTTITFSIPMLILWFILVAGAYDMVWLTINAFSGNYTVGARVFDWVFRKLIGRAPFESIVNKRKKFIAGTTEENAEEKHS